MPAIEPTKANRSEIIKYVIVFVFFAALWSFGYGGKVKSTRSGVAGLKAAAQSQANSKWASEQAKAAAEHNNLGITLTREEKLTEALAAYGEAIEIRKAALTNYQDSAIANDLASSHNNRGIALRLNKDPEAAIEDFNESVRLHTMLVDKAGKKDLTSELAGSLRNRAMAHQDRSDLDAALSDFDRAISIQTGLLEPAWENGLAEALAKNHTSRSTVHFTAGRAANAITDIEASITLRTQLVDQHGQKNLTTALASNLQAAAWARATQPDASLRNGRQAQAYARIAMQLLQAETPALLATLAAALAETGNFPEAIRLQGKAIASSQEKNRARYHEALTLTYSEKPYRDNP